MPLNIIPFFLLGVSILLFGLRGLYLYSSQKTPLIFYYGLSATLGGISALMYSVPFVLTRSEDVLKITTIVGDVFYYACVIVLTRLIWYLGFHKKVPYILVLSPYLLFIVGAAWSSLAHMPDIKYVFSESTVSYPVPVVASWFFAAMSTAFVFVGVLSLYYVKTITDRKQQLRLYLIGSSFLVGGLLAIANFLLTQGSNNNSLGLIGYITTALILFVGIFVISRSGVAKH